MFNYHALQIQTNTEFLDPTMPFAAQKINIYEFFKA